MISTLYSTIEQATDRDGRTPIPLRTDSLMASRRLTPKDQTEAVILVIADALRRTVPGLVNQDHGFAIQFTIHIRDGLITMLDQDTFDDAWQPLLHLREVAPDVGIKRIELHLNRSLPERLVSGFHGMVMLRTVIVGQTLSFAFFSRKQRKFDWAT